MFPVLPEMKLVILNGPMDSENARLFESNSAIIKKILISHPQMILIFFGNRSAAQAKFLSFIPQCDFSAVKRK